MERPSFNLSFEQSEVYEVGASLLVLLACPTEESDLRKGDLHASLCARALWSRYLSDPDSMEPITVKPQCVFRDAKRIDRDVSFVAKRIGERMVASRMAIPFLQREELGEAHALPAVVKRLSINQMAEFVMEDAEQSDANNVERRCWTPSRPVIHLAAAMAIIGQEQLKRRRPPGMEQVMLDQALIWEIMTRANAIQRLIANARHFPVKAEELIQVRLV